LKREGRFPDLREKLLVAAEAALLRAHPTGEAAALDFCHALEQAAAEFGGNVPSTANVDPLKFTQLIPLTIPRLGPEPAIGKNFPPRVQTSALTAKSFTFHV
jgi:hypothetical protein